MHEIVLNYSPEVLPAHWYYAYGITEARYARLLGDFPERNSFKHPGSETALSFFILGNIDGWKQIDQKLAPRNQHGWNRQFFEAIRNGQADECRNRTNWQSLNDGVFQRDELNWQASRLMFEFEIVNSAFHSVDGQPFRQLSFLDIRDMRNWATYDALLAVPLKQAKEGKQGVLVGIESKLGSDISRNTQGFAFVNQIMRNLEVGYWLTNHTQSLYRDWDFHYVFLCPRSQFELGANLYSWILADGESRNRAVDNYRRVLNYHNVGVEEQDFELFRQLVNAEVTVLYWDDLSVALQSRNVNFWQDYIGNLENYPGCGEVLGATLQRLDLADIEVP